MWLDCYWRFEAENWECTSVVSSYIWFPRAHMALKAGFCTPVPSPCTPKASSHLLQGMPSPTLACKQNELSDQWRWGHYQRHRTDLDEEVLGFHLAVPELVGLVRTVHGTHQLHDFHRVVLLFREQEGRGNQEQSEVRPGTAPGPSHFITARFYCPWELHQSHLDTVCLRSTIKALTP